MTGDGPIDKALRDLIEAAENMRCSLGEGDLESAQHDSADVYANAEALMRAIRQWEESLP